MDPADDVDRQRHDVFDVAVHESGETVAHADHIHAFERRADRRRADHAVDAGCRSTAHEDGKLLMMFHAGPPPLRPFTAEVSLDTLTLNYSKIVGGCRRNFMRQDCRSQNREPRTSNPGLRSVVRRLEMS